MAKQKMLVVEDNPQSMRLLEMTLGGNGFDLIKATDGEEALNTALKELPDIILMDIQLPKVNGLDVTRKLRKNPVFNQTIIIVITAYVMKGDRERIIESGCDAYISKPVSTRELPIFIEKMLENQKNGSMYCQ